ncbi:MAG: hypothetical protein A3B47_01830 [Candidatus Levybacteria bacterium RIFCSPLOWO2_01_FULL_39_24]|nr:MAG: hypothetical protein A2800_00245 [Candidatus Levybacteria bacterium RIFCSPHIGHO2_01_FULL_40_16]OGH27911.1 MAG: hypothetical protein A3E12_02165 [Candidatus Levybacteria bacterium RIFCSPHIGHO2_12_FULL_39_9]OGH46854.1 MAG: hypothetical protein A3B47_01830 [Candidatus Levybacteria bacterium RIFCSPLOWO2_01_FULL_39_24]
MKHEIEKPRSKMKQVTKRLVGTLTALTLLASLGVAAAGCEGKTVNITVPPIASPATGTPTPTETLEQAVNKELARREAEKAKFDKAVEEAAAKKPPKTIIKEVPVYVPVTPRPSEIFPAPGYEIYTPRPESAAAYGDFYSVRFNQSTGRYDLIDVRTKKSVNIAAHMVQPISNLLTGVGNTMQVPYSLNPGQAAIEQGYFVNGEGPGLFQIRMNRSTGNNYPAWFNPTITDGAVTIVPIANAAAHEADALNRAVDNNWARTNVRGER